MGLASATRSAGSGSRKDGAQMSIAYDIVCMHRMHISYVSSSESVDMHQQHRI
jgi:hypothetical protein